MTAERPSSPASVAPPAKPANAICQQIALQNNLLAARDARSAIIDLAVAHHYYPQNYRQAASTQSSIRSRKIHGQANKRYQEGATIMSKEYAVTRRQIAREEPRLDVTMSPLLPLSKYAMGIGGRYDKRLPQWLMKAPGARFSGARLFTA